jgi:hypothetical protein
MQFLSVLIDGGGVSAAVASRLVEIKGGDGMLPENALERNTSVQRFGSVVTHKASL